MYRKTGTPSKLGNKTHIWAFGPGFAIENEYPDSGKWLIFAPRGTVDEQWQKVKRATEEGKLGYASKVSSKGIAETSTTKEHIICVYTESYLDKQNVMLVREALGELDIQPQCYKPSSKYRRIDERSKLLNSGVNGWDIP